MRRIAFLLLMIPSIASAQEKKYAEARYLDGSVVRADIIQESLDIQTKYGKLSVPIVEIRYIDFGFRYPVGIEAKVTELAGNLGSKSFTERESAQKDLISMGAIALPIMRKHAKSQDMEVSQRSGLILQRIMDSQGKDVVAREFDEIVTNEFTFSGKILDAKIKAKSRHFGELAIPLSDLRNISFRRLLNSFTIDSSKAVWFDSGFLVDDKQKLLITASGSVELWPQAPGQYICGPKGKDGVQSRDGFLAGTLIGKIGESGPQFVIGERYDWVPTSTGKLYLMIVPSTWNCESLGCYTVNIQAEFRGR
jgi:hypothetical protein